ncbi:MAG TPA: EAL domain-containing protein [Acetobacteraceae bacterium]|jgi:diguanylate cyclase (GGDEF)-like protein|nr:EAL domain-containing protein [Acetobacteraceae bacterium]
MDGLATFETSARRLLDGLALNEHSDILCALHSQIERFEVALNNLTQGVCFFDGGRRLILANRRYADIYQLPHNAIRSGMTLEEIVDLRFAAGTFPDMTRSDYLAWRATIQVSAEPTDTIVELKSGQVISIHHRPMPDGGWVATHEDITERRRSEQQLAHMARHDPLTGLSNRAAFREYTDRETARRTPGNSVAVLCLDLDHFKHVNDTFGHATGDALLCAVAARIKGAIRGSDMAVRLGGDEFAIVQVGVDQPSQAADLAARLIELLSHPFDLGAHQIVVGISVGIAYSLAYGADTEALLTRADMALYRAKADGRGTYRFFERAMNEQARARHALERGLRTALRNNELELFFQPILNAHCQTLSKFEALIRWRHPERGLVAPAEFIPMSEDIGLIVPIGEWVLNEACRAAANWPTSISVAVNLSPVQFKEPNLVEVVHRALESSGLSPGRLELEITETVLLKNTATTLETLRRLRGLGVRISLDDFGTGYSSISYLRTFPFDTIKIDRSFVHDIGAGTNSLAIVNAIVTLGQAFGMSVTAEGVETAEQLRTLQAEHCTDVQGFFFSPPVPFADVPDLIRRLDGVSLSAA